MHREGGLVVGDTVDERLFLAKAQVMGMIPPSLHQMATDAVNEQHGEILQRLERMGELPQGREALVRGLTYMAMSNSTTQRLPAVEALSQLALTE